ncbi:MAG: SAM-dependent methyltransferase, partial [Rhodobacteraceae bacterium]|nr:SAM-dependent methyltransferase [Paracoccaceae bacterium]
MVALANVDPIVFPSGLVWLIGAGPGDRSLLTLQAAQALSVADVIVHDSLLDERILEWRRDGAEVIYAGKRGGRPSPKQADISLLLIDLARDGQRVARLKG